MLSRFKKFPKCLPAKNDLQAIYLGKKSPSSAGVIYDENGTNDAQLVESNCASFDGDTMAEGNTEDLYTSDFIPFKLKFNTDDVNNQQFLISKYNIYGNNGLSFAIFIKNNNVQFTASSDGASEMISIIPITIIANTVYELEGNFTSGIISGTLNGSSFSLNSVSTVHLATGEAKINIGGLQGSLSLRYEGKLYYAQLGNAKFNFAEGNGDTLYNTGTAGGDAVLTGATLAIFWGSTQDIYHYNFLNGFDLWENGTAGQEIRVPIDANVTQTGYSYSGTYQAGVWHNNSESKIQLPAILKAIVDGDCPNPLSYSEFQTNFNNANTAFSNVYEKQHKQLVFYDRALTVAEIKKLQKCLDVKHSEYALTDENGNVLTDENGLILVGE